MSAAEKKRKWPGDSWYGVVESFGSACVYCGTKNVPLTKDHIQPISRKGGGIDQRNIVPACPPCNREKGDRTAYEYWLWLRSEGRERVFRMPANLWMQDGQVPPRKPRKKRRWVR